VSCTQGHLPFISPNLPLSRATYRRAATSRAARGAFPFRALAHAADETGEQRRERRGPRATSEHTSHTRARPRATGSRLPIPCSHALMRNISVPISDISKSAPTRYAACPVLDFNARLGSAITEPSRRRNQAGMQVITARSRLLSFILSFFSYFFSSSPFFPLFPRSYLVPLHERTIKSYRRPVSCKGLSRS